MGFEVVVQHDHFPDDADDTTILAACGEHGWIYVAQDFAVRKNPAERHALVDAGVHAIFLRGRRQPADWVIDCCCHPKRHKTNSYRGAC
jgi:hypothetical protein